MKRRPVLMMSLMAAPIVALTAMLAAGTTPAALLGASPPRAPAAAPARARKDAPARRLVRPRPPAPAPRPVGVGGAGPAAAIRGGPQGRLADLLQTLESACASGDPERIQDAVEALRDLVRSLPKAAWTLLDFLGEPGSLDGPAMVKVVQVLIQEGDETLLAEMRSVLRERDRKVAESFPRDRGEILDRLGDWTRRDRVLKTLQTLPGTWARDEEIAALVREIALTSGDVELRRYALFRLAPLDTDETRSLFLRLIREEGSFEVRLAAVRALARSTHPEAGETLLGILRDSAEFPGARGFAAEGLRRHPNLPGATHALARVFRESTDRDLRLSCLASLAAHASTSDEASEVLREVLEREADPSFRAIALSALEIPEPSR